MKFRVVEEVEYEIEADSLEEASELWLGSDESREEHITFIGVHERDWFDTDGTPLDMDAEGDTDPTPVTAQESYEQSDRSLK